MTNFKEISQDELEQEFDPDEIEESEQASILCTSVSAGKHFRSIFLLQFVTNCHP
jgi:hypothetical protein